MKFTLLAAAAMIATPVIAQDTMGTQSPPATTQTMPPTTGDPSTTTSSDPSAMQQTPTSPQTSDPMTPPAADPMAMQGSTSATTSPPMTTDADPVGGYQPSAPAIQGGAAQPGATVRFQPAPPVAQAYPAPAPLASYPICKRGQYDNCRQRGGR